ncbi:MAG: Gfo/Idh/MocA family oxidoreductase [Verrucomicrobiales bacterium]
MTTRRHFLESLTMAAPWIGWQTTASGGPPSRDLRVASVGAARRAWRNIEGIMNVPGVTLVAVAEVDTDHLEQVNADYPDARVYRDWREMLDREAGELDAVLVGTPDHMHAAIAMSAMQLGLHVYCEKPLTRTVHEARVLRNFADDHSDIVTQMGNQLASAESNQAVVRALREGMVGTVREIHSLNPKAWGSMEPLPESDESVPGGLDWNLWTGVRPMRPWVPGHFHPREWRGRIGFGCSNLGDMGCHIMHPWFMGIDCAPPTTVESLGPGPANEHSWPLDIRVRWEFPGTEFSGGKPFVAYWHDEGQSPPEHVVAAVGGRENLVSSGSVVIGSRGTLVSPHGGKSEISLYVDGEKDPDAFGSLPPAGDHHRNFVDAIRGENEGRPPISHFGYSGNLTEAVLLGTNAVRVPGEKLEWDSANLRFTNSEKANRLVKEPHRDGWEVEGL